MSAVFSYGDTLFLHGMRTTMRQLSTPVFAGMDIGSATVKLVALDAAGTLLFSRYERHFSQVRATVARLARAAWQALPDRRWALTMTGSGAIALADTVGVPFAQEVMACGECIRRRIPDCDVAIELGGEDAKITFFTGGAEQRMNETCAGGTGAFIDHMAAMLNTDPAGLDALARNHSNLYPIASRCGVFAKTDILPLLNEGCAREDIAASIFQAVVEQTVSGLACGREIRGKVAFLGGPLAFLGALRQRFVDALCLEEGNAVFPENAEFFVALGAACISLERGEAGAREAGELLEALTRLEHARDDSLRHNLPPLFVDAADRAAFEQRHGREKSVRADLEDLAGDAYLGFDMGSTTTKAVCIDAQGRLLYSFYGSNKGEPLQAAVRILRDVYARLPRGSRIRAAGVTGYGSALVRAALGMDIDEVETVAHWTAARFFLPEVSYVLDIGGQDIKCLHVRDGVIDNIQLNEACSSGCGSFVETFAASLNMALPQFVEEAMNANNPIDLGTRCTVFMNSRVKQAQKEGASVGDIAAGLSYSVVRNALYKVIKIKDVEDLGPHVMAQGGAFHNDALLRALELCLGRPVMRPDIAGLMGAFGVALLARERGNSMERSGLIDAGALEKFTLRNTVTRCQGCSNHCQLTVSRFADGGRFVSGNRCERGAGATPEHGRTPNLYAWKYRRLFEHYAPLPKEEARRGVVGIPRALNLHENFPLWFTLLTRLGFRVELSGPSSRTQFAKGCNTIPSQTLCYPAKLAHGHMAELAERGVDAVFFPCIPMEQRQFADQTHHYNCPVVGGYPELLANNMDVLRKKDIPFYSPFLPLDRQVLAKRLADVPLFAGIGQRELQDAVQAGFAELDAFHGELRAEGEAVLEELERTDCLGIVLAAHPYHVDPEVHHGIPEYIASLGLAVLTEDSVAHLAPPLELRVVDQWTYHARLYRAAAVAAHRPQLALVHLVSFGCGLSALTAEQMEEILASSGRLYTQIKIDEGRNIGPARIRIRSLLASMNYRRRRPASPRPAVASPPPYTTDMRETHTILMGMVSPFHSWLMERACRACGYKTALLPDVSRAAVEEGLRLVNNDVCYPAIVTVGQLVHAVRAGGYDPDKVALMTYQTGGGCRATNYYSLLRKALADSGLGHVPIISFNLMGMDTSPGFRIDRRLLNRAFMACCLGDLLSRLLLRVEPYEAAPGAARKLAEAWLERCEEALLDGTRRTYSRIVRRMVEDFDALPLLAVPRRPRVAIVGEILVKYHTFANNRLAETVVAEGGEVILPDILDFFLYCLYDDIYRYRRLAGTWGSAVKSQIFRRVIEWYRKPVLTALRGSMRFEPPTPFDDMVRLARGWVSLGHQAGEGWLLTAEMVKYLESGVDNIICVQPFGCLPNHITGKGMFRELKRRYPHANIVAIDYDQGASEANQVNRIKLMMGTARRNAA